MYNIIICGHGNFGGVLKESLELIVGETENIETISFNESDNLQTLIGKFDTKLKEFPIENPTILLIDLFAGSPFQAGAMVAEKTSNIDLIYGINLPLLIELTNLKTHTKMSEAIKQILELKNESINQFQLQVEE